MATGGNRSYVITKNNNAQWTAANPILGNLEIGVERETGFFKIGNGLHTWNALPYVVSSNARGLIVFVSEDPDNTLVYGVDGGIKLPGEYFNALDDYNLAKVDNGTVPLPTKLYNQTVFVIGKDIKDILSEVSTIKHQLSVLNASVSIDDNTNTSINKTWSITKIVDYVLQSEINVKDELLNGNGIAYDTLQTLAAYLATDPDLATSIATELGSMVKYTEPQTLTLTQQEQVRANLDVPSNDTIGLPVDLLASYEAGLLSSIGSPFIERKL